MAEKTGTTIECDRYECRRTIFERAAEDARGRAIDRGWTRTEDGRDFCDDCTALRASRKKPRDLVPAGVPVRRVFDAAEAAGWERRDDGGDVAHFYCCGQEVEVDAMLGDPYQVHCKTCGSAIASLIGPAFGNSYVQFTDPDKVDTEDPEHWVVIAEMDAARAALTSEAT